MIYTVEYRYHISIYHICVYLYIVVCIRSLHLIQTIYCQSRNMTAQNLAITVSQMFQHINWPPESWTYCQICVFKDLGQLIISNISSFTSLHLKWRGNGKSAWWCHQMETFFALLALWEGNPPITGGFLSQRRRWWSETPSRSSWRHSNVNHNGQTSVVRVATVQTQTTIFISCAQLYCFIECTANTTNL